jgi:hypothetical protein
MSKIYHYSQIKNRIDTIPIPSGDEKVVTLYETLFDPKYKRATLVGVSISAFMQLSGISLVMFFGGGFFI